MSQLRTGKSARHAPRNGLQTKTPDPLVFLEPFRSPEMLNHSIGRNSDGIDHDG